MRLGVTATKSGMNPLQVPLAKQILSRRSITTLCHGDCIGGDEECHEIFCATRVPGPASSFAPDQPRWPVCVHPPAAEERRAHVKGYTTLDIPLPFRDRDRKMLRHIELLIGIPRTPYVTPYSGTWATIGDAVKLGLMVLVIMPTGDLVPVTTNPWQTMRR